MTFLLLLALSTPVCHVVSPTSTSDWMTYSDAIQTAHAWALFGIKGEIYCRPTHHLPAFSKA